MHILGFCTCMMLQATAKNKPKHRRESFSITGGKAPLIESFSYQYDENCISWGRRQRTLASRAAKFFFLHIKTGTLVLARHYACLFLEMHWIITIRNVSNL